MAMIIPDDTWLQVYRNLNRDCWSVRLRGRVIGHLDALALRDVTLVIQPAGQARVRASGQKNVHAYARGIIEPQARSCSGTTRARYDPKTRDTFELEDGTPIFRCGLAVFDQHGQMFVNAQADSHPRSTPGETR